MIFTKARLALAAALALSIPAAPASPGQAPQAPADRACATQVEAPGDFAAHREAALLVLAQYGQPAQTRPAPMPMPGPAQMRAANPAAEIAQVRSQAQRVTRSGAGHARAEAMDAVAAVANYRGNDPVVMNRLLARVDRAADAMHADLSRISAADAKQAGAFQCNADRLKCKEACQEAKGKACCCGCGVSYVACLVLG